MTGSAFLKFRDETGSEGRDRTNRTKVANLIVQCANTVWSYFLAEIVFSSEFHNQGFSSSFLTKFLRISNCRVSVGSLQDGDLTAHFIQCGSFDSTQLRHSIARALDPSRDKHIRELLILSWLQI